MSRRIAACCAVICAAGLLLNATLILSGQGTHYAAVAFAVFDSAGLVCGLLYLRSKRGRS